MQWYQTQFVWGSHAPIKIEITLFSNPAHSFSVSYLPVFILKLTVLPHSSTTSQPSPLTQSLNACAHTHLASSPPSVTRKHSGPKKPHRNFLKLFQVWLINVSHTLLQWHFQSADFLKIFVTVIFHVVVIYQKLLVQLLLQQFLSCLHNFRFKLKPETK